MKTVKAIAGKIIRSGNTRPAVQPANSGPVCNYADNYYGDRVCVLPGKAG